MVRVCACTYTRFVQTVASHFLSQSVFEPFLVLPLVLFCLYSSLSSHTVHCCYHTLSCLFHRISITLFTLQSLSIISSSSSSLPPVATTPSLPTPVSDPSALSSTETCPIESSRCGQGLFQSPLPPTVPITNTPRGTTPNPAPAPTPAPTPTAAGSSQFASGPITPMPDYMSMATPWLKVT